MSVQKRKPRLFRTPESGPPEDGEYVVGDLVIDADGVYWVCQEGGWPGTFEELGSGAPTNAPQVVGPYNITKDTPSITDMAIDISEELPVGTLILKAWAVFNEYFDGDQPITLSISPGGPGQGLGGYHERTTYDAFQPDDAGPRYSTERITPGFGDPTQENDPVHHMSWRVEGTGVHLQAHLVAGITGNLTRGDADIYALIVTP